MKIDRLGRLSLSTLIAVSMTLSQFALAESAKADKEGGGNKTDSLGVAITVYNQNFGLVKDVRNFELKDGINFIRFEDVAAAIDPTTVSFTSLTAPNAVAVREQNYQFDLMDVGTILSKSVGKEIKVRQYTSTCTHEVVGTLLKPPQVTIADSNGNISSHTQSIVLKTASGIVLAPSGEIEIAELPPGLVSKPSLLWKLECDKAGTHKTEISYQTQGLNWKCDYVAVANSDDSLVDLTSWVTLDNKSGATYKNAALKLMAGDVHKVQPPMYKSNMYAMRGAALAGAAAPQFNEESFAEYHLYSLANKTDVMNNETKQLTLFNAANVPVKKLYIFDSQQNYFGRFIPNPGNNSQKVNVKLELANTKENNLGMPMPKGKVRVYKRDKDEKVRVYIGDAFDLVGERKQTNFSQESTHVQKSSMEISLRNHKESPVTITCVEHSFGDWKITSSSQPYTKRDSHTFEFAVKVPADGEVKVNYDVETHY
jgi:hypothetical protein